MELDEQHPLCNGHKTRLCKYDCNYCFGRSFASHEKVKLWSDQNIGIIPRQMMLGSDLPIKFLCDVCDHIFITPMKQIGLNKSGCAYCGNQKLCESENCMICYKKSFKYAIDNNLLSKNIVWGTNDINPRRLFIKSTKKYLFTCIICNHTYLCSLAHSHNRSCPFCSKPPKQLCNDETCQLCLNKSFKSHPQHKYLSDKTINARMIFRNTQVKYTFDCQKCKHKYDCAINNITGLDRGCPYCCYPPRKLCEVNCIQCYNNSVASQWFAKNWSIKNELLHIEVCKASEKVCIFYCKQCDHEYKLIPGLMIQKPIDWCYYCGKWSDKICSHNDCKFCYNKTFASHERSKYWSKKNLVKPANTYKFTNAEFIFDCDSCDKDFKRKLSHVTRGHAWCPHCKNKTEKKLLSWLYDTYGMTNIIYQPKFNWCLSVKNNCQLPFDFLIKDVRVIVELDGLQHFKQIGKWETPEKARKRDIHKMDCAIKNGYSVIRLLQDDVWNDKTNWKNSLTSNVARYVDPKIIYICDNDEYACYRIDNKDTEDIKVV